MSTLLSFEMTGGSCLSLGPTGLWGTFNRVNLVCKSMERLMVVRHLSSVQANLINTRKVTLKENEELKFSCT